MSSSPRSLKSSVQKYDHTVRKGVGTMKLLEARLVLKPGAKPEFCRPRPVPHALREHIEGELKCLESEGFVERVSHSDWAAPIVVFPKRDGSVSICGVGAISP